MREVQKNRRAVAVIGAAGLVLALAIFLAVRISGLAHAEVSGPAAVIPAPHARVQAAPVLTPADLPTPFCWGCTSNKYAPLNFQIDLDLLAPLGDGPGNAAVWFAEFALGGRRVVAEGKAVYAQRLIDLTIDGSPWRVLPGDDPLLLEAEGWVDQARMRFYPDVWEVTGIDVAIPDLHMMLHLSRSWIARGKQADDPARAKEDFRRAIRLGRLLRQDDVTVIQDLVAIACIRIGAEAMYELARQEGDAATMVATALIMADKDAMRHFAARRITVFEAAFAVEDQDGRPALHLRDEDLASIIELLGELTERRIRVEGLIALHTVKYLGTPEQRRLATEELDEYARSEDEILAGLARRFRDSAFDDDGVREFVESMLPHGG